MSEHTASRESFAGWDMYLMAAILMALMIMPYRAAWLATFTTYFLAVLLEAIPFLILGAIIAATVETFLPPDFLARLAERMGVLGVPAVALASVVFPICECGVVAVGRGLLRKGLPLRHTIVFLLAAPIFNPVVIFSTLVAFAYEPRFAIARALGGFLVPIAVALMAVGNDEVLLPELAQEAAMIESAANDHKPPMTRRILMTFDHSRSELLDMLPYLMFGVACAAAMQTFLGGRILTVVGQGTVSGPLAMMGAAFSLSLCSEADAFVASTFVQFDFPAIVAFLVLGPMLDIKLVMMYRKVFKTGFIWRMSLLTIVSVAAYVAALAWVIG